MEFTSQTFHWQHPTCYETPNALEDYSLIL